MPVVPEDETDSKESFRDGMAEVDEVGSSRGCEWQRVAASVVETTNAGSGSTPSFYERRSLKLGPEGAVVRPFSGGKRGPILQRLAGRGYRDVISRILLKICE